GRAGRVAVAATAAGFSDLGARLGRQIETRDRRLRSAAEVEQAQVLIAAGNDEAGWAALGRATAIDPSNARAWFLVADRSRLKRDFEAADSAIARGRAVADDPQLRVDGSMLAGLVDLQRNRPREAVGHFRDVQKLNPGFARAYLFEA